MPSGKKSSSKKVKLESKTAPAGDAEKKVEPENAIVQIQLLNLSQLVAAVRENISANKTVSVRYPKRLEDSRVDVLADGELVAEADLYFDNNLLIDKESQCLMRPVYFMRLRKISETPTITVSLDSGDNVSGDNVSGDDDSKSE